MLNLRVFAVALTALTVSAAATLAGTYPVTGRWTYDYSPDKGPAKQCGARYMDFRGERRFDTGGGVPDYRNVSMSSIGAGSFALIDEFDTGQIDARLEYTLTLIDKDHLRITLASGPNILLRRCA